MKNNFYHAWKDRRAAAVRLPEAGDEKAALAAELKSLCDEETYRTIVRNAYAKTQNYASLCNIYREAIAQIREERENLVEALEAADGIEAGTEAARAAELQAQAAIQHAARFAALEADQLDPCIISSDCDGEDCGYEMETEYGVVLL